MFVCVTRHWSKKNMVRFRHGTVNADAPNTESRHCCVIVSDGCTLFQHYNMCCAQIVVANRIVFSNSPLGYQWIENRGPCKNVIPFTGLIFFSNYLLTQNSEIIMILCVCLRIYHYFWKKYINLAKKRQQRYLAVTLNAVRRAKCFFKKKLSKVLQS